MRRRKIITIALFLVAGVLVTVVLATPITPSYLTARLGAFTGPESGTAQDDNVKASLDLAHTDLDTGIQNDEDKLGLFGKGPGNIFYVDSDTAGSAGTSWATAVGTIDAAVNLCTTGVGDIILVAAGHSEELTAADGVDVDKAGITIIGLGVGEHRPLLDYTNANGEFVIGADDVAVYNLQFKANVTDVAHAIDVETGSENWVIDGCRFYVETTGTDEFTDAITTTANCDNGKITNCRVEMGAGGADAFVQNVGCDYVEISNNIISGDFATACIEDKTTASIWLLIDDNILVNGTVGGDAGLNTVACISLKSDTSAVITNNKLFCNVASPELAIIAADGYLSNNTYSENEGNGSGQIIGTRAGETYFSVKTGATVASDDLFDVDGGPIIILGFWGLVTTNVQAQANTCEIILDADSGYTDHDFTTAVELNGDAAGTRYVFDGTAGESVLTPCEGADGGAAGLMVHWFCGEGMIESNHSASNTGAITWYMMWTPVSDGTTVTVQ